ncbi:MAG: ComF family protein [Pseudomonadota bacterium]
MSISRLLGSALDACLPRACLLCGDPAGEQSVCAACAGDLPRLMAPLCPVCATPLPRAAPACGACLTDPPAFDATLAAWRYAFPLDDLVRRLKFGRRLASADFFAAAMQAGTLPGGDVLMPVPLSRERLRARGFNQALEIARPLARALRLPLDTASLARVRDAEPQSRLPWNARHRNVRHAFACHADLTGKAVILVDDVMTSGATLDAAARALKERGATRVTNWVAARAIRDAPG